LAIKFTTEREEIRHWAEIRNAKPALDATTSATWPGVMSFDFESGGDSDDPTLWDAFFAKLEAEGLGMLYEDNPESGEKSNFFRFADRSEYRSAS
jgi:hypothetical protein